MIYINIYDNILNENIAKYVSLQLTYHSSADYNHSL